MDNSEIFRPVVEQRSGQPDPTSQDGIDYARGLAARLPVGAVVASTGAYPQALARFHGPHRAWIKTCDDSWIATSSDDAFGDYDIGDLIASGGAEILRPAAAPVITAAAVVLSAHPIDSHTNEDGAEECEGCEQPVGDCVCVCVVCDDPVAECACPDGPTI